MRPEVGRGFLPVTIAFVLTGLALGAWLGARQIGGVSSGLDAIENLTLDWRFRLAGGRAAPQDIIIVAIDDETIAEAEDHALSRAVLGRIVHAIADRRPRLVAVDLAFPDPKGAQADRELSAALKSTASIVASIGVFRDGATAGEAKRTGELALAPRPSQVLWPTEVIRDAAGTGLANLSTDSSGVPRYAPLLFETPEGVVPSFALAAASAALAADPVIGPDRVGIAGRTSRLDLGYNMPIRYYGPAGTFSHYGAATLLSGDLDPKVVRDRIVLVGVTATGLGDVFATPFDRAVPGVEILATAIGNLLEGDALVRTAGTRRIDAVVAAGLPAAMIALIAMRRAAIGLGLAALALLLWAIAVFVAFVNGYWLSMATPLAASVPLAAGYTGARFVAESRAGRRAAAEMSALARFQSPALLEHMLREPKFLREPVRHDVAVMFVDLSGFTGVAESLGPERSRDLLHEMQTLVEREVSSHKGVVMNYMGDGVMAAFGLPQKQADDAARALLAAESLHDALADWLAASPSEAKRRLDFRIGAHFGPAILSRLGSPSHQQIAVAGDTVNVASRLLEVAKQERRRVVVTEDLFAAARIARQAVDIGAEAYSPRTVPVRGRAGSLTIRIRD